MNTISEHHFAVIMWALGAMSAIAGWYAKRRANAYDRWRAKVDRVITNNALNEAAKPEWEKRMERYESGIVDLGNIVTKLTAETASQIGELKGMITAGIRREVR